MKTLEEEIRVLDNPKWFTGANYMTVMGSRAYGTNTENSDWDFYGFVVPPIEIVFPHLKSSIDGFGRQKQRFEQIQHQHIPTEQFGEVDITIYNIVKYFQLLMECNPNIIDSIFTSDRCLISSDEVSLLVRKNRKLFLSQKCFHTFKGMMFSHLSRIKSGHIKEGRKNNGFGWDVKDGYHSLRMALQLKDICFIGDLDLEKYSYVLNEVRNGKWSKDETVEYCEKTLRGIEENREFFIIPDYPPEKEIKKLLVECLKIAYGNDFYKSGYLEE
jgi:predicted nucleotidyltransferase